MCVYLDGWVRVLAFAVMWCLCFLGIGLDCFAFGEHRRVSMLLYVVMGWFAVVLKPMLEAAPREANMLMLAGGIVYTAGIFTYIKGRENPRNHAIWHVFVIVASIIHYFAVYFYVVEYSIEANQLQFAEQFHPTSLQFRESY